MAARRFAGLALVVLLSGLAAAGTDGDGAADAVPRGVHLGIVDDPMTTMAVTWFTDGPVDPESVVEYGVGAFTDSATGTSHEAAPQGSGVRVHEVHLAGLLPGVVYDYRVGGGGSWSSTYSFRTDDGDGDFRMAVFGDHGTDDPTEPPVFWQSQRTTANVVADRPDLVIIAGDLSYANGHADVWDAWFDQIEPLAAHVPVVTAIGNHEWEGEAGTGAFRTRLALPGNELFFSFDYGRAHFLVLQSHLDGILGDMILAEMAMFAESDLSDAAARRDAGEIDLLFVVQHHPLYSNSDRPERRIVPQLVALEEQWFLRYGVDVLLVGHDHYYDRSRPMVYGQPTTLESWDYVDPVGTVMVVTGGGGRGLYDFDSEVLFYPWSANHAKRFHFVRMDVDGGGLAAKAVSTGLGAEGQVFDAWTLTRTAQSSSSTGTSAAHTPLPAARSPSGVQ